MTRVSNLRVHRAPPQRAPRQLLHGVAAHVVLEKVPQPDGRVALRGEEKGNR